MEENEGTLDENEDSLDESEGYIDSLSNELQREKNMPSDLERERFEAIRKKHLLESIYDNAMNGLIEQTGVRSVLENEAVSMAIRYHGLTYSQTVVTPAALYPEPESSGSPRYYDCAERPVLWLNPDPYSSGPCTSTTGDDILSHAVSAAIKKKGLGAVDR